MLINVGEQRAKRFMLVLLGLQRLSYLVPSVMGQFGAGFTLWGSVLLAVTLAWNVAVFAHAYRRGWFPQWIAFADVLWAMGLVFAVPAGLPAGASALGPLDWSTRMGQAAAALAGAALPPARACLAVGPLLAAHAAGVVVHLGGTPEFVPELVSCLNGVLWFAVIIGYGFRYLSRQGRLLDEAVSRRVAAESRHAADRARLAHHRALHDTVLATLTAISRGAGGVSEQVRDRAARDSDYLRRLLRHDNDDPPSNLREQLSEVVTQAEALGLRVHYAHDDAGGELPAKVVAVLRDATREALNNVLKHAGTATAWLTVVPDGESVMVRIVDRGKGFDPQTATAGFGLSQSVRGPMAAAAGAVRVLSSPGEGTCVELRWRR